MDLTEGYLDITLGCMFSGKTTELIRKCSRYSSIGTQCLILNSNKDTRCNDEIMTHNKEKMKALKVDNICDCMHKSLLENFDIIGIDEGQFFNDLYESVIKLIYNHKKIVFISSLDGDYKQEKFGQVLELIPHSNSVVKLHALCKECKNGNRACFTKRIVNKTDIELVGSEEYYQPVCRKHL